MAGARGARGRRTPSRRAPSRAPRPGGVRGAPAVVARVARGCGGRSGPRGATAGAVFVDGQRGHSLADPPLSRCVAACSRCAISGCGRPPPHRPAAVFPVLVGRATAAAARRSLPVAARPPPPPPPPPPHAGVASFAAAAAGGQLPATVRRARRQRVLVPQRPPRRARGPRSGAARSCDPCRGRAGPRTTRTPPHPPALPNPRSSAPLPPPPPCTCRARTGTRSCSPKSGRPPRRRRPRRRSTRRCGRATSRRSRNSRAAPTRGGRRGRSRTRPSWTGRRRS